MLAIVGAAAGVLVVVATSGLLYILLAALDARPRSLVDPFFLAIMGGAGALVAAIVAPIVAWTLLRRVPLGKAIVWPTVGAAIGTAGTFITIGILPFLRLPFLRSLIQSRFGIVGAVLGGGLVGLLIAAIRLRRAYRPPSHNQGSSSPSSAA
jgi:hypothetical protein